MPTKKTAVATTAPLVPLDLTVEQRNLDRALRLVDRAVPARTTLPALGHVLLNATPAGSR